MNTTLKKPNYRIYDRTGGGVTQDIYVWGPSEASLLAQDAYLDLRLRHPGMVLFFHPVSLPVPSGAYRVSESSQGVYLDGPDSACVRCVIAAIAPAIDRAREQGRAWIDDGDWVGIAEEGKHQIGVPLECCVREIVYVPDLRSIEALPGVFEAKVNAAGHVVVNVMEDAAVKLLPGKVIDGSTKDEDGCYDVVLDLGEIPQTIDEDATREGDAHDCSGEYSDTLPECEQSGHAGDDADTEGHDWRQPYSVVGGCKENPGYWSLGGTATQSKSVCRCCGKYKTETDAGSQRNPGQARSVVTIEDRDSDSEAWLKRTHADDDFLPQWLAEMLDCSASLRTTKEEAAAYVEAHDDQDSLDDEDLEHAFAATFGRRAEDDDRQQGLWSHLCASCKS